jgi:hypothetical protein
VAAAPPAGWERLAGTYALPDGGAVTLEARDGALVAWAEGQAAVDALAGGADAAARERALRLNARTDSLLRAAAAGDWAPLHGVMDTGAPLEEFAGRMREARADVAARLGAYRAHRVLGTAPRGQGVATVVRVEHERGASYEMYGWEGGQRIAGFGRSPSPPALRLQPTPDGGWAAYDLRTRRGSTLRVTGEGPGARLTITTADGATTTAARR